MQKGYPVAIVTGTSSGFGMLTALELARAGYFVFAGVRSLASGENLLHKAQQYGVRNQIDCVELDVTDHEAIEGVVGSIVKKGGERIDVLVNNAGMSLGGFIEELPLADWRLIMDTNFIGMVALTRAVLPYMRKARAGKIINMSSISGRVAFPGYGAYAASKFAVEGFSESLRLEMLPYGIYVSLVEPGAYKTDIWSKGFNYADSLVKENSPYKESFTQILTYSKSVASGGGDPQEIADTVVKIAKTVYPKLRYPLGKGARLSLIGKALLPWKWFERIIISQLRK